MDGWEARRVEGWVVDCREELPRLQSRRGRAVADCTLNIYRLVVCLLMVLITDEVCLILEVILVCNLCLVYSYNL